VCLLRLVVNCTVAVRVSVTCCSGDPPSAVVHFLTRMTSWRVTLRSTARYLAPCSAANSPKYLIISC